MRYLVSYHKEFGWAAYLLLSREDVRWLAVVSLPAEVAMIMTYLLA